MLLARGASVTIDATVGALFTGSLRFYSGTILILRFQEEQPSAHIHNHMTALFIAVLSFSQRSFKNHLGLVKLQLISRLPS